VVPEVRGNGKRKKMKEEGEEEKMKKKKKKKKKISRVKLPPLHIPPPGVPANWTPVAEETETRDLSKRPPFIKDWDDY